MSHTRRTAALTAAGLLAALAAAATAQGGKAVTYLPADRVNAAFAKGMPLIEVESYKVHASRREAAGQAEVHAADTDIIHVLTGSATFVTGGTVVDGHSTAPEEIRGASIRGGESRRISAGDVLVVPNGVPHWFQEVPAPMTYYVVKVRTGGSR